MVEIVVVPVKYPYTKEVKSELAQISPIVGCITSVPHYMASHHYGLGKMYERDIKRKEANADLPKWEVFRLNNLGLARWYYEQCKVRTIKRED